MGRMRPRRTPPRAAASKEVDLDADSMVFQPLSSAEQLWTSCRLIFALPWRRFKKGSILSFELEGDIGELLPPRFSKGVGLPSICEGLIKAAYDPRIIGVFVKISPLECGWGKLSEIRRHVEFFNQSGKFSVAYMEEAGEKEYYLASVFKEIYVSPLGYVFLRGLSVSGTFLRAALDKAGIEPQVKRIGNYKSAGDQLLREEMSEYQREQLQDLLDDLYDSFLTGVSKARGISRDAIEKALDEGLVDMKDYKEAGFFTDTLYTDQVVDMFKERQNITDEKKKVKRVSLRRYKNVSPSAFALNRGKKAIAVIRTSGAIASKPTPGLTSGSAIISKKVIRQIKRAVDMKNVVAIVLRVDSPGGEAFASDVMWREIQQAAKKKPVIASMVDLAASGGYYIAMAADKIVAEDLTITGSIGVVLTKIQLGKLYDRIGVAKETLSKGRYAEIFIDNRSFTEDEDAYFSKIADYAYAAFRNKAAESRGMESEEMEKYAQGRVWSGKRAAKVGLVDEIGGINKAIRMAREKAEVSDEDRVRVIELSRQKGSPLDNLKELGVYTNGIVSVFFLVWGMVSFAWSTQGLGLLNAVSSVVLGGLGLASLLPRGDDSQWEYTMDDIEVLDSKTEAVKAQAILESSSLLPKSLDSRLLSLLKGILK